MYWLRLIRWTNLIIVFLTQILVWLCIIRPAASLDHQQLLLQPLSFLLLCISTVFIAAAGYIINDYFDIRIDGINRPEKMVLEHRVPRRVGIVLHNLLNVLAIVFAWLIIRSGGNFWWISWQLACTVLLWFYSTHFKRQFAVGNIVVAMLTSFTILILYTYEPALQIFVRQPAMIKNEQGDAIANPVWMLLIYAFFAFVLTWIREIVKDMEDFKGDEADGCRTMPIVWGLGKTTRFAQFLAVVVLIPLVFFGVGLLLAGDYWLGGYSVFALVFPIIAWMIHLPRKATSIHYRQSSRWLKMIMVSGIGSLIIYYLEANG